MPVLSFFMSNVKSCKAAAAKLVKDADNAKKAIAKVR